MSEFVPHKIDSEDSFESHLLGDVKAGFPSPAEDIREKLDLIKLLVKHKASTFFFRVSGVSMVDAALDEGDIIIVDRAIDPYNNCKAVDFDLGRIFAHGTLFLAIPHICSDLTECAHLCKSAIYGDTH